MNILKYFLIISLFSISCNKNELPEPAPLAPKIEYINYDGGDITIQTNDTFNFSFQAFQGAEKIEDIIVSVNSNNNSQIIYQASIDAEKIFNSMIVDISHQFIESGMFTVKIEVIDEKNVKLIKVIDVIVI